MKTTRLHIASILVFGLTPFLSREIVSSFKLKEFYFWPKFKILLPRIAFLFLSASFSIPLLLQAQPSSSTVSAQPIKSLNLYKASDEVISRIKEEGMNRSQVMQTLSYLTDVIGPRLTNSPAMKQANEWTRDTMAKWGLQNAHLEFWGPFGRGWKINRFSAQVTAPQNISLIAYPKAWSPSTTGILNAAVVYIEAKTEADLDKYKGQLKGKIVLTSSPRQLEANFTALGRRHSAEDLANLAATPDPVKQRQQDEGMQHYVLGLFQDMTFDTKRVRFLLQEGAALMVENSKKGTGGTVFVTDAAVATEFPTDPLDFLDEKNLRPWKKEAEAKMLPQITLATEHYNRLVRMMQQGAKLTMSVDLQA